MDWLIVKPQEAGFLFLQNSINHRSLISCESFIFSSFIWYLGLVLIYHSYTDKSFIALCSVYSFVNLRISLSSLFQWKALFPFFIKEKNVYCIRSKRTTKRLSWGATIRSCLFTDLTQGVLKNINSMTNLTPCAVCTTTKQLYSRLQMS